MDDYPTFMRLLWVLATGWTFVTLVVGVWCCFGIPAAVVRAKSLGHRGSWWALYVLGLHAVLAPVYRRLWDTRSVGRSLSRMVSLVYQLLTLPTGAEIPLSAKVGRGLLLGHTAGVVLNTLAVVGEYCVITPGVVVGGDGRGGAPTIGRNVYIGANAVISGSITVGDSATIGACTVVTCDVPASALVVGNPGAIVKENYKRNYHDYAKEAGCD